MNDPINHDSAKNEEISYELMRKRIKSLRKALGLTQNELAERAGLTPFQFGEIERGRTKGSIIQISDIARALKVTTDFLITGNNADPDPRVERLRNEVAKLTSDQMRSMSRYITVMQDTMYSDETDNSDP